MSDIQIVKTSNTNDPKQSILNAYEVYDEVYNGIEPFKVLIFPKTPDDFKPDETLLALHKDEILGVAVLKPVTQYTDIVSLFGENALDVLDQHFQIMSKPVNRISNMAVLPKARGKGIAQKLYQHSALVSNGNCIAAITENNTASRYAALKAGYIDVPECHYSNKLSFQDNRPILDSKGKYALNWFLMKYQA